MAVVVRRVQTYAVREYLDAGPEDLGQLSSRAVEPLKCMRRQKSWREHGLLELMLVRRAKIGVWGTRDCNNQSCVPRLSCFSPGD